MPGVSPLSLSKSDSSDQQKGEEKTGGEEEGLGREDAILLPSETAQSVGSVIIYPSAEWDAEGITSLLMGRSQSAGPLSPGKLRMPGMQPVLPSWWPSDVEGGAESTEDTTPESSSPERSQGLDAGLGLVARESEDNQCIVTFDGAGTGSEENGAEKLGHWSSVVSLEVTIEGKVDQAEGNDVAREGEGKERMERGVLEDDGQGEGLLEEQERRGESGESGEEGVRETEGAQGQEGEGLGQGEGKKAWEKDQKDGQGEDDSGLSSPGMEEVKGEEGGRVAPPDASVPVWGMPERCTDAGEVERPPATPSSPTAPELMQQPVELPRPRPRSPGYSFIEATQGRLSYSPPGGDILKDIESIRVRDLGIGRGEEEEEMGPALRKSSTTGLVMDIQKLMRAGGEADGAERNGVPRLVLSSTVPGSSPKGSSLPWAAAFKLHSSAEDSPSPPQGISSIRLEKSRDIVEVATSSSRGKTPSPPELSFKAPTEGTPSSNAPRPSRTLSAPSAAAAAAAVASLFHSPLRSRTSRGLRSSESAPGSRAGGSPDRGHGIFVSLTRNLSFGSAGQSGRRSPPAAMQQSSSAENLEIPLGCAGGVKSGSLKERVRAGVGVGMGENVKVLRRGKSRTKKGEGVLPEGSRAEGPRGWASGSEPASAANNSTSHGKPAKLAKCLRPPAVE